MLTKKLKADALSPDKLSELIRDMTLRRNAVAALNIGSARIVWATMQVIKEYAGQDNYDKEYEALCAKMCEAAQAKIAACDAYLTATNKELDRLMEISERRYLNGPH